MIKFANGARVKIKSAYFDASGVSTTPIYWYSVSNNEWFNLSNWYTDNNHSLSADALPNVNNNVYILGTVRPIAYITGSGNSTWVNPHTINVSTYGMGLSSSSLTIVETNFRGTGTVSVSGSITIDDPT